MKKQKKFIQTPQYPGGRTALAEFIKSNLKYPDKANENEIEGVVVVVIDINENGDVIRTRFKKKLGYGCDEEAQRVAKLLKFKSVKNRKVRVTAHRTINFNFRKPKQKKIIKKTVKKVIQQPGKNITITYTFVPKKKPDA